MIDTAHLSPWLLLVAPLVVTFGYIVFGMSGFGSTAIVVPILAHFLPVPYLVPLMVVLDTASSLFVGTTGREHVSRSELAWLVPFMFCGFLLGATVIVHVPDRELRLALGIFAAALGIYGIANPTVQGRLSRAWVVPVGVVGGAVATVFGAGGPVYATYLSARLGDKNQVRATMSVLISISAVCRAAIYAVTGLLLHVAVGLGVVLLAPFAWMGLRLGTRIHTGLTQEQMRRVVGALLLFTGLSLVARPLYEALAR